MSERDKGPPPDLSAIQRWFQSVVTHPDGVEAGVESADSQAIVPLKRDELERMVTRSKRVSARDRISIYANAYYARLLECLGETFPVLKRTLGEDVFNGFAFGYLQKYPSRSYTLNDLGDRFADYLDETRPQTPPEQSWPDFLVDLARYEWTINQVFDGPGVEGERIVLPDDLKRLTADTWPNARLRPSPCLRLLALRFPLTAYYTAARQGGDEGEKPPMPDAAPGGAHAAITRRDYVVRRYELSHPQHELLRALCEGATVGESIERAAEVFDGDLETLAAQLQEWFQHWTAGQFFIAIELWGT